MFFFKNVSVLIKQPAPQASRNSHREMFSEKYAVLLSNRRTWSGVIFDDK